MSCVAVLVTAGSISVAKIESSKAQCLAIAGVTVLIPTPFGAIALTNDSEMADVLASPEDTVECIGGKNCAIGAKTDVDAVFSGTAATDSSAFSDRGLTLRSSVPASFGETNDLTSATSEWNGLLNAFTNDEITTLLTGSVAETCTTLFSVNDLPSIGRAASAALSVSISRNVAGMLQVFSDSKCSPFVETLSNAATSNG